MHSRIFANIIRISVRTGLAGLALAGVASASEHLHNSPMSGACFLHDSGLEYIPTRLLGFEDIAMEHDRDQSDARSWTCVDPTVDCAVQAERHEQRRLAMEQWNRYYSSAESLKTWSMQSLKQGFATALRQWNSSLIAVGYGLAHRVTIESPLDPNSTGEESDFVEDSYSNHCMGGIPAPRSMHANIFVFSIEMETALPAEERALKQQQSADATCIASPSDRIVEALGGTTFARDYCVFAPYPLSDEIIPLTETSDRAAGAGPVVSAVAGNEPMTEPSQEPAANQVLRLQRQAALDFQRSLSRNLARKLSLLGQSLIRWSEELDSNIRLAEAMETSRSEEVK